MVPDNVRVHVEGIVVIGNVGVNMARMECCMGGSDPARTGWLINNNLGRHDGEHLQLA
jgi:hypothetical protein